MPSWRYCWEIHLGKGGLSRRRWSRAAAGGFLSNESQWVAASTQLTLYWAICILLHSSLQTIGVHFESTFLHSLFLSRHCIFHHPSDLFKLQLQHIIVSHILGRADHRVGVRGVIYALFDSTPTLPSIHSTPADQSQAQRNCNGKQFENFPKKHNKAQFRAWFVSYLKILV